MGENPEITGSRSAVRSPMQWSNALNGGFSRAEADDLIAPLNEGGFGGEHVNVAAQLRDDDSLLGFTRRLVTAYRFSPEIGWGELELLESGHPCVLAHRVTSSAGSLVAVHNFAADGRSVELDLGDLDAETTLVQLIGACDATLDGSTLSLTLEGYGAHWIRLVPPGSLRLR